MPLVIKDLSKAFGDKNIFCGFSYKFPANGVFVLVGESGRVKTTLLRIIAGLDKTYTGEVTNTHPAYAFQEYRLFPNLSALENVTRILYEKPNADQVEEAKALFSRFGFSDKEMQLYPVSLSGGMKQRVALCRAILARTEVLLLDEPFKELDVNLRATLRMIIQEQAKERLIILTAHSLDALGDIEKTIIDLD